ncbi:MAG: methionyl-tRNA formyltransferase [Leptolyngbyaceae cyanobacterium]
MRIVYFGTPQFAVPSLQALMAHADFEVAAVVTQPDKRRGRGKQVMPSPVKAIASEANLPVWQPQRLKKDAEILGKLTAVNADAFVVVAYGQILSRQILEMPRLGCVNAHGSLLPKYRGAAPIQWCLYHGESETGIDTMLMDEGMDTGPVLLEGKRSIGLLDNALDLAQDLAAISAELLPQTLNQLAHGSLQPTPQDDSEATYAPLIKKVDFELDWSKPAIALHNQVRGFYPNCVTRFRDKDLKIVATVPLGANYWDQLPEELQTLRSQVANLSEDQEPGTVAAIAKSFGPIIQTSDGLLLLQEVKPSGKKAQSGWDFANGNRLEPGEKLG